MTTTTPTTGRTRRPRPPRRSPRLLVGALTTLLLAAAATAGAPAASAATSKLCGTVALAPTGSGEFNVQNNNYSQSGKQCVSVTEDGFTLDVAEGKIAAGRAPKSYPSLVAGCHWARCTTTPGLPIRADDIGAARTGVSLTPVKDGSWNAAYDLWFDKNSGAQGQNEGTELMIWFNGVDAPDPIGKEVGQVSIAGATWTIWQGNIGWDVISFIRTAPATEVDLPLAPFVAEAIERGATEPGDWLTSVQVGIEPWAGGQGLAMENFTYDAQGQGQGPGVKDAAPGQETRATGAVEQDAGQEDVTPAPTPTAQEKRDSAPGAKSAPEEASSSRSGEQSASGRQGAESAPDPQERSAPAPEAGGQQASDAPTQEPAAPAPATPTSSPTATTEKPERAEPTAGEPAPSTSAQPSGQEPKDSAAPDPEQDRADAESPAADQDATTDSAKPTTPRGDGTPTAAPTPAPRDEKEQKEQKEEEKAAATRALEDAEPSGELPATAPIKPGLPPEPRQAPASGSTDEKGEAAASTEDSARKWWQLWLITGEDTSVAEQTSPEKPTTGGESDGEDQEKGKSPEQTRPTTTPTTAKEKEKEKSTGTGTGTGTGTDTDEATRSPAPEAGEESGYAKAALADEPVMLLTGDTDGETMADVVDPGREVTTHGSATPATTPDGGSGVDLDGTSDYLQVDGKDLSIADTGQLTVEILMRPDRTRNLAATEGSSEGPMVHVLNKGSTFGKDGDQEWATRVYDEDSERPGRVSGYAFNPQGGQGAGSYDQGGLETGQWVVVTAVFDTTKEGPDGWGTVTVFRDGQEVDTDSLGQSYQVKPKDGGSPLFVGGGSDDGRFDGAIGAVAVYPTAQSEAQIAERADAALNPQGQQNADEDASKDKGKDSGTSTAAGTDAAGKGPGNDEEPTTGAAGKTSSPGKSTDKSAEQEEEPTADARAAAGATEKAGATS